MKATFLILGAALDNRTAMGKDYAVELSQEYHSVAESKSFLVITSTRDFASRRDTFREAGTEMTRAVVSEVVVRIKISSPG